MPDIDPTITNGGNFNFLILIKQYDIIPNMHIAKTVGKLHDAIGLCTSTSSPPKYNASL